MEKRKAPTFDLVNSNMTDEEVQRAINETLETIHRTSQDIKALQANFQKTVDAFDELIKPSGKTLDTINMEKLDQYIDEHFEIKDILGGGLYLEDLQEKATRSQKKSSKKGNVKSAMSQARIKL